jgi:hypothetical protein
MTNHLPPKLATALLKWFGPDRSALAGDLVERYQSSESRWWFWRQVLAAIFFGAVRDGRSHPLALGRGLVIGWGVMWVLAVYAAPIIVGFDTWLFVRGVGWFYLHGYHIPSIYGLPWILASCATCIGGNVAVRASGLHGPAAALTYTLAIFCTNMMLFLRWFLKASTEPAVTYGVPPYSPLEVLGVAVLVLPLAALVGGFSARMSRRTSVAK